MRNTGPGFIQFASDVCFLCDWLVWMIGAWTETLHTLITDCFSSFSNYFTHHSTAHSLFTVESVHTRGHSDTATVKNNRLCLWSGQRERVSAEIKEDRLKLKRIGQKLKRTGADPLKCPGENTAACSSKNPKKKEEVLHAVKNINHWTIVPWKLSKRTDFWTVWVENINCWTAVLIWKL